ncbi:hypothetical protein [Nostoc sp. 'Peltigera membranacea cyanobiont' 232]|uniref:hypothetical protein n=1 Tax=Nostoc sp. 'Peltigera membranacea cyanobiont' 232 TaxID=2014531 RepID=UPI000B951947|nr:hypothetical protein [Nostoc sp. 'Peltigera membranacea cyanobiont' 232]OYE01149.1 hypothetical protein CDG79_31150 [Nostoc sp. 'Peltigera membranacea cyanobiont' 232]
MRITQRKLHIGAAIAVVLYSVIYTAFVVHGNVAAAFFIVGLWVLSSFSDQTRWLFYAFLIAQAWANWHLTGLLVAIAFVGYCVTQNIAYRKAYPASVNTWRNRTFAGIAPSLSGIPSEAERERQAAEADEAWRRQLAEEQREREQEAMEKRRIDAEYTKNLWGGGDSDQNSW